MSLRQIQREAVLEALKWGLSANTNNNNNSSSVDNISSTNAWRVLVLDAHARDVIAPLLKVKELREQAGVTLHLRLDKPRQGVAGAPSIYLCMPTEANVDEIAKDVESGLFSEYRIQFLAAAPRTVLERLAKGLQNVSSIHNVFVADRALNFVSLQSDLFTVPNSERICYTFNSSKLEEKQLENHVGLLAQSLSHVAASLSPSAPFVSYMTSSSGSAAEAVAHRLHSTLHDHVKERTYFANSNSPSKTLFLIVDRMSDLSTALHHHFSYRSLLSDALHMKLNKVVVDENSKNKTAGLDQQQQQQQSSSSNKQLEVDPETDLFWNEHSERDFSTVHEYIESALANYRKEHQALMASEGISSTGDAGADLARLMQQAPKLADRKRSLDTHTTLAYQCLQAIKSRHWDELHGVEQALLHPASESLDKETLEKLLDSTLADYQGVLPEDRQRLLLMCYLAGTEHNGKYKEYLAYVERYLSQLETANSKIESGDNNSSTSNNKSVLFPALAFLKKLKSFSAPGGRSHHQQQQSSSSSGWSFATGLLSKLTGGDKNACPVSRVADTIHQTLTSSSSKNSSGEIIFLDPRVRDAAPTNEATLRSAGINHLVVFVVGGVCPIEYDDLLTWAETKGGGNSNDQDHHHKGGDHHGGSGGHDSSSSNRHRRSTSAQVAGMLGGGSSSGWNVTVGGTEVLTGESLLSQLTDLGKE